jgi:hypothetical protein
VSLITPRPLLRILGSRPGTARADEQAAARKEGGRRDLNAQQAAEDHLRQLRSDPRHISQAILPEPYGPDPVVFGRVPRVDPGSGTETGATA